MPCHSKLMPGLVQTILLADKLIGDVSQSPTKTSALSQHTFASIVAGHFAAVCTLAAGCIWNLIE